MSPIGMILIGLIIGTSGLVIAAIWLLIKPDKKTCILSTAAAGFITAFLVSFVDIAPPVITQRENTFSYTSELWIREIAQVYDTSDSNPLLSLVAGTPSGFRYNKKDKTIRFPGPNKYMLTFEATDKNGNHRTKTFAVHIIDDIPPKITLKDDHIQLDIITRDRRLENQQQPETSASQPQSSPETSASQSQSSANASTSAAPGESLSSQTSRISENTGELQDAEDIGKKKDLAIKQAIHKIATAYDDIDGDVSDSLALDDSKVLYDIPGQYPTTLTAKDSSDNEASETIWVIIHTNPEPETTNLLQNNNQKKKKQNQQQHQTDDQRTTDEQQSDDGPHTADGQLPDDAQDTADEQLSGDAQDNADEQLPDDAQNTTDGQLPDDAQHTAEEQLHDNAQVNADIQPNTD